MDAISESGQDSALLYGIPGKATGHLVGDRILYDDAPAACRICDI
jgi:hypothetical protein